MKNTLNMEMKKNASYRMSHEPMNDCMICEYEPDHSSYYNTCHTYSFCSSIFYCIIRILPQL